MSHEHDHGGHACCAAPAGDSPDYRRILWIALIVNAAMFGVEIASGLNSGSASLLADAVDFFGDAVNYGLSLAAMTMAVVWRSRTAWLKGATMTTYGIGVLALAAWRAWHGATPEPAVMGLIGGIALVANVVVALMLYAWREGDANMRSVWLCSRNDAIGNLAVMAAALGVFGTGTRWPDLAVAALMGGLAISAGLSVLRAASRELAGKPATVPAAGHGHAH